MKTGKPFSKVVAVVLSAAMLLSIVPMTAFAAISYDSAVSDGYYTVISKSEYALAPGATETEMVLNNSEGSRRQIAHVFEVDTKNENIQVLPGYYGIDKLDPDNLSDSTYWTDKQVTKTVEYYEDTLGYNVVGAMNTALAYDSNAPYGYMVYNGVVLGTPEIHEGAQTYLAIDYDGNCELRSMSTPLTGNEETAISANFGWLVKDGALVTKTPERTTAAASRSMIGIKADGTLVFCQVDGRVAPTAVGLSNYEMGEMMLALGCVNAVNCDGGGSSTFVSKREGEAEPTMRSIPSDGSERPTINSVILVSNAKATGEFDHAVLNAAYDYYAPYSAATMEVTGVDPSGAPAEVPAEGVIWQLSDASFGTIENGVFTSNGTKGDVTVQMVYDGNVVGEKTIHVVDPEVFAFNVTDTVIPYGKSVEIEFACTYGVDDWAVCVDGAYTLTMSDDTAATIDGNKLTASSDETKTGLVLTATYKADNTVTATMNITFGKGSEVIYDFEDGDLGGFVGFDEAKQWAIDNGVNNTLVGSSPLGGQCSDEVDGYTWAATKENGGQVKNGNGALAWTLDNTTANFAQWTYNVLFNVGETIVLRDTANGMNATTLGMWLYIPEGAAGLAFQSQLYTKSGTDDYTHVQAHYTFRTASGTVKNLNSCTEADIPESRWVYASIDLTGYDYLCTPVADYAGTTTQRSPSFVRTYVKPMVPAKLTFYIDDITLDYSSAVDDRVAPTISDVSYATADTAVVLENDTVIEGNTMAFSATIADNTALNYATGTILVDGKALPDVTASGKTLASGNVTLADGKHTVTFEIQDKLGNLTKVTRDITVGTGSAITLTGHNESGAAAEYDSVYYVDITAADMASVEKLTTVLKLQSANTWETEGAVVAPGYKASFDYNENANLLTVTVTKTGTAIAAFADGDQTLVSIPVRVWSWDTYNHFTGEVIAPETQFATGNCPIVTIDCEVIEGEVVYADNSASTFGGAISVATNLNDNTNPWHTHTAVAMDDLEATCTTDGYTGRTYCEGCASVVDWGTIVPATGHSFAPYEGQLVCHCGEVYTETGLVTIDGGIYYSVGGVLQTGWQLLDTWYYFDATTYAAVIGELKEGDLTFVFDEEGRLTSGVWVINSKGMRYRFGPSYYTRSWHEIDGATYYFGTDAYAYTGYRSIPVNRNNPNSPIEWYLFGEDAKLQEKLTMTGFLQVGADTYYLKDGCSCYAGLIEVDGDIYYVNSKYKRVTGYYSITKTNDILPAGPYYFGEDGKLLQGIADGKYYVNGTPTYAGLIEIDGDYYYVNSACEVVTGSYNVTKTNGLMDAGVYYFDANGKMGEQVKEGLVQEDSGLYYYKDGARYHAGLIYDETEGCYYYIRTSGKAATGKYYIYASWANGLLPAGEYDFGADGKYFPEPVVDPNLKNGIYEEDGAMYYYKDGERYHAGLMYVAEEDYYYYVRTSGKLATGTYYIYASWANGLLPAGSYDFGTDGKYYPNGRPTEPVDPTLKNGIYAEDGALYYYKDGARYHAGLIYDETEGCYYYVRTSGKLATGTYYIYASWANGLLPAGSYDFGTDGKLFI